MINNNYFHIAIKIDIVYTNNLHPLFLMEIVLFYYLSCYPVKLCFISLIILQLKFDRILI